MQTEEFFATKIKCQGCASTIKQGLATLPGVSEVTVDVPSGKVLVTGEPLQRQALHDKLAALGYPERA